MTGHVDRNAVERAVASGVNVQALVAETTVWPNVIGPQQTMGLRTAFDHIENFFIGLERQTIRSCQVIDDGSDSARNGVNAVHRVW